MDAAVGTALLSHLFRIAAEELAPAPEIDGWVPLTDGQVRTLEGMGNSADDWSGVTVTPGADLSRGWVVGCRFLGRIRINLPAGSVGTILRGSVISRCELGPGCTVDSVGLLHGVALREGAVVRRCSRVSFEPGSPCGCGSPLELGEETGLRTVLSFPLLDPTLAAELSAGGNTDLREAYEALLQEFLLRLSGVGHGTVGVGAIIEDTAVVEDSFFDAGVLVSGATCVRNSTLLGGDAPSSVTDGAIVRGSILQWGSSVDSLSIVEDSVVGECARVERHGKLISSLLGPDSVLGEGEMTACLAGPFTAAHHQSLLIAARWPQGRGNVAYGANVGSNHTSRLPDQEIRPGEGMFFGLGCSVKFPADYFLAPYSIVATGVTTLPQRVEMPFSLICEPFNAMEGLPPAFNQIIPAWVLGENLYSVLRNRCKYLSRGKAVRSGVAMDVFRPEILEMMMCARDSLLVIEGCEIYTEAHLPGLGKNFMSEKHRVMAVETYSFHIRMHAIEHLLQRVEGTGDIEGSMAEDPLDRSWAMTRDLLAMELPDRTVPEMLGLLGDMWDRSLEDAERSRARDYERGARVIGDYALVHGYLTDDPLLAELRSERERMLKRISSLIS